MFGGGFINGHDVSGVDYYDDDDDEGYWDSSYTKRNRNSLYYHTELSYKELKDYSSKAYRVVMDWNFEDKDGNPELLEIVFFCPKSLIRHEGNKAYILKQFYIDKIEEFELKYKLYHKSKAELIEEILQLRKELEYV